MVIAWSFCKDLENNFLLASSAGGRIPAHLQMEGGFEDTISSLGENSCARTAAIDDELENLKRQRMKMDETMDKLAAYIDVKAKAEIKRSPDRFEKIDKYIDQVERYSQKMNDSALLDTMSPESKETYVAAIKRRRKQVLKQMDDEDSDGDYYDHAKVSLDFQQHIPYTAAVAATTKR